MITKPFYLQLIMHIKDSALAHNNDNDINREKRYLLNSNRQTQKKMGLAYCFFPASIILSIAALSSLPAFHNSDSSWFRSLGRFEFSGMLTFPSAAFISIIYLKQYFINACSIQEDIRRAMKQVSL